MMIAQFLRQRLCLMFLLLLLIRGHQGFFIKHSSGLCVQSKSTPFVRGNQKGPINTQYGPIYYAVFQNTCLHPDAQFRFYEKCNVLYNIGKDGTFFTRHPRSWAYRGGKYQIYHSPHPVSITTFMYTPRCVMKQTPSGSLKFINSVPPYCATSGKSIIPANGDYVIQTINCADEAEQKFIFGSVTNESKSMIDVSCSPPQVIKVFKAEYGIFNNEIFDYNKDANCSLPSTCIVKSQCDNQSSCNMTVNSSLFFKYDPCPGKPKQLYMEYVCVDSLTTPKATIASKVRLSELPNQGFIEIFDGTIWRKVVDKNWDYRKNTALCHFLGYNDTKRVNNTKEISSGESIASGYLYCSGIQPSSQSCCAYLYPSTLIQESRITYTKCTLCEEPLLQNITMFPDNIFSASHLNGHEARVSSNGWCPQNSGIQYLQIDLQRDYFISHIAIFGDKEQTKWTASYDLQYSRTLRELGSSVKKTVNANRNAHRVSITELNVAYARFLRITVNQGNAVCIRVQLCGHVLLLTILPDPVRNIIVNQKTARTADISWALAANEGHSDVTYFLIAINDSNPTINLTRKAGNNQHTFGNLKPYRNYKVIIHAGNAYGPSDSSFKTFITDEAVPDGPPLEVVFDLRSKTFFTISWESPEKKFWNGIINKYKVCHSTAASAETCFEETSKTSTITNLQPAKKYFVKVAAGTTAGFGVFSNQISKITNQEPVVPAKKTSYSLSLSLQKPQSNIKTILVIIQAAQSSTKSSDSYQSNELKPYSPGSSSPYVTAVFSNDDLPLNIIIGDGTSYKLDGTIYINQRLNENTDYIVFIRFIETEKNFYSTEWSNSITTYNRPTVTGITVGNITAKTASISWILQPITGPDAFTYLLITVKQIVFSKVLTLQNGKSRYTIENLKPYSNYVVSVQPGNAFDDGETVSRNFMTHEAVPSGPPLNVKVAVQSSSSLLISWKAPELQKQNGVITNYTICLSHYKDETCFQLYVISNNKYLITNLRFSTKYSVRVCASTRAGCGNYSLIQEAFTDEKPLSKPFFRTANTLSFLSQKPNEHFGYYEVIAVYLSQNTSPARSPNTYTSQELSHYSEVKVSSESIPYIAAVFSVYDGIWQMFTLGDGINYSKPRIITDNSEVESYFNGPLKENGTYSVFQRFYKDWNNYYSTGWSPPASTNTLERCAEKAASKSPKRSSETSFIVGIAISLCLNIVLIALVIYLTLKAYRARSQNVPSDNVVTKVENRAYNDDIYEEPEILQRMQRSRNRTKN